MGLTGYYQTEKDKENPTKEPVKKIFSNWTTGEFTPEFKELFNNRVDLRKVVTNTDNQGSVYVDRNYVI